MPPVIAFDADVVGRRRTGDETWTTEVLCALGALTLPFRVLAYLRDPAALPARATACGTVVPVPVQVSSNYMRGIASLPARLRADRPSLYQGTYLLPVALPCPGVVAVHDVSFLRHAEFMPALDRAAFRRFVPWSVRRAARVIALSEHTRHDILDLVPGLDPARVITVHPGVSSDFHPVPEATVQVEARFGVHEPYVLFLGALQRRKNLRRLLEAWRIVRESRPDIVATLVLAGAPKARVADDLDAIIAGLGITGSVRRLGYVEGRDSLRLLVAGARALALPSLYEGFGLPALEAMACGTPVVAANATALPEATGGAAVLVDPLDPRDIAAGLARVLGDDGLHTELRARGLAHARCFTWMRTAEALADAYTDVLAERAVLRGPRARGGPAPGVVSASVVSHGDAARLGPCLALLGAQRADVELRTTVVCNLAHDGSAGAVRRDFPTARVLERVTPRGFSANHNAAHQEVASEFVLVLNPDVVLDPECLAALVALLRARPRCGMAVPLLRHPDGGVQPSARRFPRPLGTLLRRTPLRCALPPGRFDSAHLLPPPVECRPVDWALGACLLVRRRAWDEVGGFDERAFPRIYVEDIDLAWRLWQAGWEVWQTPEAVAVHEHQAATDRRFLHHRTLWHAQGMWRFVRKHPLILAGYRPGMAGGGPPARHDG